MTISDDAPTGVAPTELAGVVETEAHTAWSLDDNWEDEPQRTPGWIVACAVGAAVVAVAITDTLAYGACPESRGISVTIRGEL